MYADIEKVIAYLKYSGIEPEGISGDRNFYWRYFIQKITRMLHGLGMELSYCWTIRVRGPYSNQLARDYYQHERKFVALDTGYRLSEKEAGIANRLNKVVFPRIKDAKGFHHSSPYLESISTALDLMGRQSDSDDSQIFVWMKTFKPHLDDETIVIGINSAKELLFKPEYLTAGLRSELDAWEKLDG